MYKTTRLFHGRENTLCYAMNGVLLTMVIDKMLQDGNILRKYNNYELLISEGKVIKI